MEKNQTEEKQNTPDLDRLMQDGRPVFPGTAEPAGADVMGPVIIGQPGQDTPPETPPPAAPGAQEGPPKPAVAPLEPAGKGEAPPRGDYRFKTLEEADKSYRLLQGEKTRVELKLKTLETEADVVKSETRRKVEAEAEDVQFMGFATQRNKQALEEINDLNPDDPEYTGKAASCWARANAEIRKWKPEAAAASSQTPPAGGFTPRPDGGEEEGATLADQGLSPQAVLTTKVFIEDVLSGADLGIPKDDPTFWSYAEQSPAVAEDGTPIPLKDQIWWAVERTLLDRRRSAPAPSAKETETPAAARAGSPPASPSGPTPAMPMGRSAASPPPGGNAAQAGPMSLSEAVDYSLGMRRL